MWRRVHTQRLLDQPLSLDPSPSEDIALLIATTVVVSRRVCITSPRIPISPLVFLFQSDRLSQYQCLVCPWELMESATTLTGPSELLRFPLILKDELN